MILTASFQTTDCRPSFGFQWNLTKVDWPSSSRKRKVWTPKPSMKRNERGIARSDMTHMIMCMLSGVSEMKSQKLSCADWACGKVAVGLRLDGVDEVGKLDRVLDEEDRNVVADEIPVALLGVELHRKAAHIAREVERALAAGDGREAHERLGLLADALEDVGAGDVGQRVRQLEKAVSAVAARVDDAFGNALVVEVENLLAEMKILKQRRSARTLAQSILIVGDRNALLRRKRGNIAARGLMDFPAVALGFPGS